MNREYVLPVPGGAEISSFEKILSARRSTRKFQDRPLSLDQAARILWAAQGITSPHGFRTAPSAGALYPLEVYLVAGRVDGIPSGIYRYRAEANRMVQIKAGENRKELRSAALSQSAIIGAPASVIITGVIERTRAKYGGQGVRYVLMEAGHAGQNVLLQAVSLGLGAVPIGAFDDGRVRKILGVGGGELPIYIIPVGYPSSG